MAKLISKVAAIDIDYKCVEAEDRQTMEAICDAVCELAAGTIEPIWIKLRAVPGKYHIVCGNFKKTIAYQQQGVVRNFLQTDRTFKDVEDLLQTPLPEGTITLLVTKPTIVGQQAQAARQSMAKTGTQGHGKHETPKSRTGGRKK